MSKRTTKAQKPTTASENLAIDKLLKDGGYIVVLDAAYENKKEADKAVKALNAIVGPKAFRNYKVQLEAK
jgi:hypothetical protein